MSPETEYIRLRGRIRWLVALFICGLLVSGATAIPIEGEIDLLVKWFVPHHAVDGAGKSPMLQWLLRVRSAIGDINTQYPFIAYGGDWLAFGHFMIALAFIGAWRDPMQNRWLFDFGLLACVLVLPYAMIFGAMRGIPLWWRLIDCLFGLFGAIPLCLCRCYVRKIADKSWSEL